MKEWMNGCMNGWMHDSEHLFTDAQLRLHNAREWLLLQFRAQPRIPMRQPQLAGRLTDAEYSEILDGWTKPIFHAGEECLELRQPMDYSFLQRRPDLVQEKEDEFEEIRAR